VQARGGRQRLAYRTRSQANGLAPIEGRTDQVILYGGGVGYRVGENTRIGLNLDYTRRSSPNTTHDYKGLRGGLSVMYGF
jgi:hypothetical protein